VIQRDHEKWAPVPDAEFYKYETTPVPVIEAHKRNHTPGWGWHCNRCGQEIFDFICQGIEGRVCVTCFIGHEEPDFWEFV
jgi:hypothetical protein